VTDQAALRQQLLAMIQKGRRALQAAEDHAAHGDADFAASKAYYAVFHLMQAVLLTKGRTYSKHAGVISGFSEQFIKPGIVPMAFGEAIQRLRKHRELGDYGYQLSVEPDEATRDVHVAAEIVDRLVAYLQPFVV